MIEEKVLELGIESKLSECQEIISELLSEESIQNSVSTFENLNNISYIVNGMKDIYSSIDVLLTPIEVLKTFNEHLQRTLQNLVNFNSQKTSTAYLTNASNALETALKSLPNLYVPKNLNDLGRLKESVQTARRSISQLNYQARIDIERLKQEFSQSISNTDELINSLSIEEENIQNLSANFLQTSKAMYESQELRPSRIMCK